MSCLPDWFATAWYRCGLQLVGCGRTTATKGWTTQRRVSDLWELHLLFAGTVQLTTSGSAQTAAGPVGWLRPPASALHETVRRGLGDAESYSFCFAVVRDGDAANPLDRLPLPVPVAMSAPIECRGDALALTAGAQPWRRLSLHERLERRGHADRLLLRHLDDGFATAAFADSASVLEPQWLRDLMVWIREQVPHRSLTSVEVVAHSGYGRTCVTRTIRRCHGTTIHGMVQRERLRFAADCLLRWPERSVTDIAQRLGYPSSSLLCRHFRIAFGHSPGHWRRAAQGVSELLKRNPDLG